MFAVVLIIAALVGINAEFIPRIALEPNQFTTPSRKWSTVSRAEKDSQMTVFLMMKHEPADVASLEKLLMSVSDPQSSEYGQHKTLEELNEIVPISQTKLDLVSDFLHTATADTTQVEVSPGKDIIKVTLSVADVERLFQTEVSTYQHKHKKHLKLHRASAQYTVPVPLSEALYVVADLVGLPRISSVRRFDKGVQDFRVQGGSWDNQCTGLSGCKGLVTPFVLKDRYSVTGDDGLNVPGNSFSVAEFQGQYFSNADLKTFSQGCSANVTVDDIIGGNSESMPGVEAELDIEYIKGVSGGVPLTVIYSTAYSLIDWVNNLIKMPNPPLVNSVSYGNDEKQQTSTGYMLSCNVQFMKAGTMGLSLMFASGDQGVCGREGCGIISARFKPDFPAGSPYITAVGGTDFLTDAIGEETAWGDSGGGFSDTFGIPSYQSAAVATFKASPDAQLPKASLYNNTGRGYPDISALGGQKAPYCVVVQGHASGVAGTSASCPTAAAVFARLNGLRLKAGKQPLGFLNPFIYQNAGAFNDVTSGSNKCSCGLFEQDGFTAIKGWDPVTGVGTPNFAALAKLI